MEQKQQFIFLYLQPIEVSVSWSRNGKVFEGENQLTVLGPDLQGDTAGRKPVKVRELIKVNREYRVYNKIIHFYNFLYAVEIQKSLFDSPSITQAAVQLNFMTKNAQGECKIRSF